MELQLIFRLKLDRLIRLMGLDMLLLFVPGMEVVFVLLAVVVGLFGREVKVVARVVMLDAVERQVM